MLPLMPHTLFVRNREFVKEEWEAFFAGGAADKAEGGWKGVLYGNYATIDPRGAWEVFTGGATPAAGVSTGGSQLVGSPGGDSGSGSGNGNGNGTTGTGTGTGESVTSTASTVSATTTPGSSTPTSTATATPTSTSVPTTPSAVSSKMVGRTIRRALEKGKEKMGMPSIRATQPKAKKDGFGPENIDGGASLTWYLTWCAGKLSFLSPLWLL